MKARRQEKILRRVWSGLLLAMLLLSTAAAYTQEKPPRYQEQEETGTTYTATYEEQYAEGLGYIRKLRPEEIPKFNLVQVFFELVSHRMTLNPTPEMYHMLLEQQLEIEPGSAAADELTTAALDYQDIWAVKLDKGLEQLEWRAANLGVLYASLLRRLEARGYSTEVIESFVEDQRAGVSITLIDDEPNIDLKDPTIMLTLAFDREFERASLLPLERFEN